MPTAQSGGSWPNLLRKRPSSFTLPTTSLCSLPAPSLKPPAIQPPEISRYTAKNDRIWSQKEEKIRRPSYLRLARGLRQDPWHIPTAQQQLPPWNQDRTHLTGKDTKEETKTRLWTSNHSRSPPGSRLGRRCRGFTGQTDGWGEAIFQRHCGQGPGYLLTGEAVSAWPWGKDCCPASPGVLERGGEEEEREASICTCPRAARSGPHWEGLCALNCPSQISTPILLIILGNKWDPVKKKR